jgi:hypothetical protein
MVFLILFSSRTRTMTTHPMYNAHRYSQYDRQLHIHVVVVHDYTSLCTRG